jgi:hypothetical protein
MNSIKFQATNPEMDGYRSTWMLCYDIQEFGARIVTMLSQS